MAEFVKQFGIDWRLLISQAANFLIVLIILRVFVYKPVANILRERRRAVEEGIAKSEEADQRLRDSQEMAREKIKRAENAATALLREVDSKAKEREALLLESSRRKGEVLLQEAVRSIEAERAKARAELDKEARGLLRSAVVRVVDMNAEAVDDALLEKALTGAAKRL
jgi:F-type H+-transporting ATPase subunit b